MMLRGTNKSNQTTMMRVNVIVTAFVAVWLFNGHYHLDGVGMVAAATLGGGGEEEAATTTRGTTMMTKTVVDEVTAPTRKLIKSSKAFKPDADNDNMESLLRLLVFDKAMALYSFSMEKSQSSAVGVRRELLEIPDGYEEHACNRCLAMFEKGEQYSLDTDEQRDNFCDVVINQVMSVVSSSMMSYLRTTYNRDNVANYCNELMQCPLRTSSTPTACCQSQGLCQDPAYYCKLNSDSGSTENYWIQTETKAACDTRSMAIGCGACKDEGSGDAILEKAGMPTDGFVSYCRGGPCVWTTQKTQCMGLKNYPDIKNQKDCADACCNDYTCAVWQFDADGYSNQCWYGKNCDKKGGLTWTYGGIREMGTDQAPDCAYYCKLSCDSGSCENYLIQTETKAECDTESTALGCGACKDKDTSDAILEQAGMPTNGFSFVSYCQGGPCVWTTQKTQYMGLKYYPALTTPEACKDACCGDYTCAVWQFDADGYRNQCWYGPACDEFGYDKNCDEKEGDLTWTYGGIRKMGCDQAPNCVGLCESDDYYYYIRIM